MLILYLFAAIQGFRTFSFLSQRFSPFPPIVPSGLKKAKKIGAIVFKACIFVQVNHGVDAQNGKTSNNVLTSSILVVS